MRTQQVMRAIVTSATTLAALLMLQAASAIGQGLARDLSPQPLAEALEIFAEQTGLQLVYRAELAAGMQSRGARAGLSAEETLRELLRETGLTFEFVNDRTIAIRVANADARSSAFGPEVRAESAMADAGSAKQGWFERFRLAQTDASGTEKKDQAESTPSTAAGDTVELGEVVVTGTHIRGATRSASPIQIYTRDDIDQSGLGTLQDFVKRIPQNFNGGASEDTIHGVAGGTGQETGSSSVNLRGLGSDSTLILVNGRRLAPADRDGHFIDISLIPMNAVDRVEVLTDGASAIYGSDAVGGVVNFVLRRDFDKPETRARYGSVTNGESRELQLGQTAGLNWSGGSALLSYEYFDRTPLDASERLDPNEQGLSTQLLPDSFTLLPEQERHGAMLTAHHAISPGLELFAEGTYSRRSHQQDLAYGIPNVFAFSESAFTDIDAYSASAGARADLSDRIGLELSSSYARSQTHTQNFTNDNRRPSNRPIRPPIQGPETGRRSLLQ